MQKVPKNTKNLFKEDSMKENAVLLEDAWVYCDDVSELLRIGCLFF